VGVGLAVIREPAVVSAADRGGEAHVFHRAGEQADARVEECRVDAVEVHVGDARVRIEAALAALLVFPCVVHDDGAVARTDRAEIAEPLLAAQHLAADQQPGLAIFVDHRARRLVAVRRVHVALPKVERFEDMSVGVDDVVGATHDPSPSQVECTRPRDARERSWTSGPCLALLSSRMAPGACAGQAFRVRAGVRRSADRPPGARGWRSPGIAPCGSRGTAGPRDACRPTSCEPLDRLASHLTVETRSALVVPECPNGTPAATTISCPCVAKPSASAARVARVTASLMVWTSGTTTAWTPHTTARRRAVSPLGVRPSTGPSGRSRATRSAVPPEAVKATIACAPMVWPIWRAAAAIAPAVECSGSDRLASVSARQPGSSSTRATMRSIMFTAS